MRPTPAAHARGGAPAGPLLGPAVVEKVLGALFNPEMAELLREHLKPLAAARDEFDLLGRQLKRALRRSAVAPDAPAGLLPYPPPGSSREALHELAVGCGAAHAPVEVAPGEFAILGPVPYADRIMGTGFTRGRAGDGPRATPWERAGSPAHNAALLQVDALRRQYTEHQAVVTSASCAAVAQPLSDAELETLGAALEVQPIGGAGQQAVMEFADRWRAASLNSTPPPARPQGLQLARLYVAWPPVAQSVPSSAAEVAAYDYSALAPFRSFAVVYAPAAYLFDEVLPLQGACELEGTTYVRMMLSFCIELHAQPPPCECCPTVSFAHRGGHYSLNPVFIGSYMPERGDACSMPHAAAPAAKSIDELLEEIEGPAAAPRHSGARRHKGRGAKQGAASAGDAQPLPPAAGAMATPVAAAAPPAALEDEGAEAPLHAAADAALAAARTSCSCARRTLPSWPPCSRRRPRRPRWRLPCRAPRGARRPRLPLWWQRRRWPPRSPPSASP